MSSAFSPPPSPSYTTSTAPLALVTGAEGFIGSHLCEALVQAGWRVRALVQYNSFNQWGWLSHSPVKASLEVVLGDVRDPHQCQQLCQGVETVFHLAALIAIPYSYQAPQSYIDTNVSGTLNMLQAALQHNVQQFIHTSTSEVYGTARHVPIDEQHPLQPQSPYSASKIAADSLALSYHASFELPVTVARPFNTYGPRQSARAVIPTIISQLAQGVQELKLGDTRPTRDFNYVADTVAGFLALANHPHTTIGKTVNIASNYEVSIADTVACIQQLMGTSARIVEEDVRLRPAASEVFRLWGDNTLLHDLTGYRPTTSLQQGLEQTIAWFQQPQHLAQYQTLGYVI
ncbi:MAG: NAD-dependent 4,6-dehydratase LegB [Vampirovibrionales bacterium]